MVSSLTLQQRRLPASTTTLLYQQRGRRRPVLRRVEKCALGSPRYLQATKNSVLCRHQGEGSTAMVDGAAGLGWVSIWLLSCLPLLLVGHTVRYLSGGCFLLHCAQFSTVVGGGSFLSLSCVFYSFHSFRARTRKVTDIEAPSHGRRTCNLEEDR